MYKIKELVERNYDFALVYPEKQKDVRQNTGLDFNLENIAKFLQKQTNNFTIDNTIAKDLDEGIYKVVSKFEEEQGKQRPTPTPTPTPDADDELTKNLEAIESMILYADLDDVTREAIDSIVEFGEIPKDKLQSLVASLNKALKEGEGGDAEQIKLKQDYIKGLK